MNLLNFCAGATTHTIRPEEASWMRSETIFTKRILKKKKKSGCFRFSLTPQKMSRMNQSPQEVHVCVCVHTHTHTHAQAHIIPQ